MKHCVKYPDDKFLAVRPCLVAICFGNRPAAKLLGALLYRYNLRVENKDDAENQNAVKAAQGGKPDQDTTYRIFRRQAQLVEDMCGEMTEKTLHDTAVPMLQVMGYLELEEHIQCNCYTVNIEQVQEALNLYSPTSREQLQLEKFLISKMQLEKFLITVDELEKFLIDKKNFLSGLEKVLIWNRNFSNCQRGRKRTPQEGSEAKSETPKNLKESTKKNKEEQPPQNRARDNFSSVTSLPPPKKPEPVSPLTVPICLALADHYRGYLLTNGNHGAIEKEAIAIVRRGITYERLDRVYRYMKGLDKKEDGSGLYDEYWEDKTFDLSHVNKHLDAKEKEIKKKEATRKGTAPPKTEDKYIAHIRKKAAEVEEGVTV